MAFDLHSTRSQSDERFTTRCGLPENTSRLDESLSWKATAYFVHEVVVHDDFVRERREDALMDDLPRLTGAATTPGPEEEPVAGGPEFIGRETVLAQPGPRGADRGEADHRRPALRVAL